MSVLPQTVKQLTMWAGPPPPGAASGRSGPHVAGSSPSTSHAKMVLREPAVSGGNARRVKAEAGGAPLGLG